MVQCQHQKGLFVGSLKDLYWGPLLYINDLPDCLEKLTPCLYADDSQIFSSAKDCVELNANLNHDLNNVSQWLVKNKLQHHSTKTKLMYVASNHNLAKIDNEFPVMIN